MTSTQERALVAGSWSHYAIIERKGRNDDTWRICSDHPLMWDWSQYSYRSIGAGPVNTLETELRQAEEAGEPCIFSQDAIREVLQYLYEQRPST